MCRRNQLFGMALVGFGLGLLLSGLFESAFFCGLLGIGILCGGFVMVKR